MHVPESNINGGVSVILATSPGPIRHLSTASEFTEGSQGASNGVTEPYEPTANDVTVVNHLATDSQGFVVLNRRSDVLERFVGDGFVDFADSPPGDFRRCFQCTQAYPI